jgi:polysaccharide pyruvyl transferase CsaB
VHGVAAVRRADLPRIARTLRAADGLVSGGGSLLQDRTSARPVAYYAGVMLLARALRRPYVVHAQGLGPIRRAPNRRLAATALRAAAAVSLRDPASIALARELGVRRPIELVPDAALALDVRQAERPANGPIVVAVRPWATPVPYLDGIRTALERLAGTAPIVALPMQRSVDLVPSRAVVAGVPGARVLDGDLALDDVLATIGGARLVLGMRLHALILAAAAGVPAAAISYDPKVDAFAAQAGQPVAARVDEPIDAEALAAAVRATLAAGPAETVVRVDGMRADLRRAAERSLAAIREARR